jgi:hypothetical protein
LCRSDYWGGCRRLYGRYVVDGLRRINYRNVHLWVGGAAHPAGCQDGSGSWHVTAAVTFANAPAACAAAGFTFGLPRTGVQNSGLHTVAGPAGGAWVNYIVT